LRRHGVLCVKKHIKAKPPFFNTKAAGQEMPPPNIKQDFKKLKKAGNVRQPLMVALLLH